MDPLPLLRELLRRPSLTPDDAGCLDLIADRLLGAGFTVRWLNEGGVRNLWATHGAGDPIFVLNGHVDVVPPGPLNRWTHPPFEAVVEAGELYGRGAVDMKASVAAMTEAVVDVARDGHPGTLAVLLTSDEEGPAQYGSGWALQELLTEGQRFDGVVVIEPTSEGAFGDAVKTGRRGSATAELTWRGKQGHTAYPHLADNAAHRMVSDLALILAADWARPDPGFPPTSVQVAALSSGAGADNVIPGEATARLNFRFGPSWSTHEIHTALVTLAPTAHVELECNAYPFLTEEGRLLDALEQAVETEVGARPRRSNGGGTSDARWFAASGVPVAEFGPLNATLHAIDERVEVACLAPLARIYANTARRFLGST